MSLRDSVLPAVRAVHPALFPIGLAIVALQTALSVGLAAFTATFPGVYAPLVPLVGPFVVLAVTLPLAAGLYEPVRERTDTTAETLRVAALAIRRLYGRLLGATVVAFAAAFAGALTATSVAFVLVTVAKYVWYVTGDPAPPNAALVVWTFPVLFAAFFAVAVLVTRFADAFVAYDGADPRTAWRASATFARRHPRSFLGYAVAMVVFLGTPQILPFAVDQVDGVVAFMGALTVVVFVGTVGLVFASAIHVTYFERSVREAVRNSPPAPVAWTRVAAVSVVLVAAVAGAGYVRTVDAGAGQAELRDLPEDPEAAYAVAATNTREANHRRTVLARNASEPGSEFRTVSTSAVDYDDRQVSIFYYGDDPDVRVGGYQSEGTIAMPSGGGSYGDALGPLTSERNGWTVVAAPGYAVTDPTDVAQVPAAGDGWTVETSNSSTVVYRVDDPEAIRAAVPGTYRGMHDELADESALRVVVDRDRGVVDTAHLRVGSLETGHVHEYEMRYAAGGTVDVERPAAIGERSPLEWFWDALYY